MLIVGIVGALLIGVVAWALFGRNTDPTPPPVLPTTSPSTSLPTAQPTGEPEQPATTEPQEPPTNKPQEPPVQDGERVELDWGLSVTLPVGWTVVEREPDAVVVSNGLAYLTLQSFRVEEDGVGASQVMVAYIEQMKPTFQNPTLEGPLAVDAGTGGTAEVMAMTGTRVGSAGAIEVLLVSTIAVRSSDSVSALSAILVEPVDWEASVDDYNAITSQLLHSLLG